MNGNNVSLSVGQRAHLISRLFVVHAVLPQSASPTAPSRRGLICYSMASFRPFPPSRGGAKGQGGGVLRAVRESGKQRCAGMRKCFDNCKLHMVCFMRCKAGNMKAAKLRTVIQKHRVMHPNASYWTRFGVQRNVGL